MTTTEFVIWLIAIAITLGIAGAIALRHRQASRRDEANRVRAAELREEAARQQEEREESQLQAREADLEAERARLEAERARDRAAEAQRNALHDDAIVEDRVREADRLDPDSQLIDSDTGLTDDREPEAEASRRRTR